jgi:hypothetical protein
MRINSLLENVTPSSSPAGLQSQQAPKFGRDPNVLEDDKLDETTAGATGSGAVASVSQPMGTIQKRKGSGALLRGISTSEKYPNSKAVKEAEIVEQDIIINPSMLAGPKPGFHNRMDMEGDTVKNSLHTIIRVADDLNDRIENHTQFPEWVSEKIGAIKSMMVNVMDYVISQQERGDDHVIDEFAQGDSGDNDRMITWEQLVNYIDRTLSSFGFKTKADKNYAEFMRGNEGLTLEYDPSDAGWFGWAIGTSGVDGKFDVSYSGTDPLTIDSAENVLEYISSVFGYKPKKMREGVAEGGFDIPEIPRSKEPKPTPKNVDENLHKWFKEKWVRFGPDGKIRGDCARGDDSEGKPKCLPQSKAHSLGKKGRASAAARKRREDPNPERSGKAINVATKKKTNETNLDEKWSEKYKKSIDCSNPKGFSQRAHCQSRKKNEDVVIEALANKGQDEIRRIQQMLNTKFNANLDVDGMLGPLTIKSIKKFLPASPTKKAPMPNKTPAVTGKKIKHGVKEEQLDEKCWDTHKQVGMKKKGGRMVPNCVPKESVNEEQNLCPHCGGLMYEMSMMNEKKDACYYKVKSRYKVWPSAYASGALVKCRKKGAKNWGTKSEGVEADQQPQQDSQPQKQTTPDYLNTIKNVGTAALALKDKNLADLLKQELYQMLYNKTSGEPNR